VANSPKSRALCDRDGQSAAARRAVPKTDTAPLVAELKNWFEAQLARVSAKSVIAGAFPYGLNHWHGLARFLEDGRIEIDMTAPTQPGPNGAISANGA
jgi:hypothetical protein